MEEVIAESYDDPKGQNSSGVASSGSQSQGQGTLSSSAGSGVGPLNRKLPSIGASGATKFQRMGHYGCPNKSKITNYLINI